MYSVYIQNICLILGRLFKTHGIWLIAQGIEEHFTRSKGKPGKGNVTAGLDWLDWHLGEDQSLIPRVSVWARTINSWYSNWEETPTLNVNHAIHSAVGPDEGLKEERSGQCGQVSPFLRECIYWCCHLLGHQTPAASDRHVGSGEGVCMCVFCWF